MSEKIIRVSVSVQNIDKFANFIKCAVALRAEASGPSLPSISAIIDFDEAFKEMQLDIDSDSPPEQP